MPKNSSFFLLILGITIWITLTIVVLAKAALGLYDAPNIDGSFLVLIPALEVAYIWQRGGRVQKAAGIK